MIQLVQRKLIFTLLFIILCLSSDAQSNNTIVGKWQNTDEKDFQVEIYLVKDNYFFGKVINDKKTPSNNGTIILHKFIYNTLKKQFSGIMTPPDANIELYAEIIFVDANKIKITAHKLLITKTMYLSRIE